MSAGCLRHLLQPLASCFIPSFRAARAPPAKSVGPVGGRPMPSIGTSVAIRLKLRSSSSFSLSASAVRRRMSLSSARATLNTSSSGP